MDLLPSKLKGTDHPSRGTSFFLYHPDQFEACPAAPFRYSTHWTTTMSKHYEPWTPSEERFLLEWIAHNSNLSWDAKAIKYHMEGKSIKYHMEGKANRSPQSLRSKCRHLREGRVRRRRIRARNLTPARLRARQQQRRRQEPPAPSSVAPASRSEPSRFPDTFRLNSAVSRGFRLMEWIWRLSERARHRRNNAVERN